MLGVPHGFAITSSVARVSLSMWGVVIEWCVFVMVVVSVMELPTVCACSRRASRLAHVQWFGVCEAGTSVVWMHPRPTQSLTHPPGPGEGREPLPDVSVVSVVVTRPCVCVCVVGV